ncbi:hypothetical protein V6Z11_D09G220700 [Gossypium hirsutum]
MIEPELNNTLIMLIPKKESPEDFSHFRPISLCSVLYKLQAKAVDFFEELYGEAPPVLRDIPNIGFPSFNSSKIIFLEATIINEEIKSALFDMAPLKAPRSHSFHAHFFQNQWDILGNDVCQWVQDVFSDV